MSHVGEYAHPNECASDAEDEPYEESDPYSEPPRGRVMMIMDENGNATKVTLGAYHIESVHRDSSAVESLETTTSPSGPKVMRKADTVRADVPAQFNTTGSDDSEERGDRPRKVNSSDGPEFEQVADEVEVDEEDTENDQYMRISAPAAKLKDVSKVKKDLYHDRPERQGSKLLRVLSVKGSDRLRGASSISEKPKGQSTRNSIGKVGRLMSVPKQNVSRMEEQSENTISDRPRGFPDGKGNIASKSQIVKDAQSPKNMRRSISSVGRMLSKSRKKGGTVHMPDNRPQLSRNDAYPTCTENMLPERARARTDSGGIGDRASKTKAGGGVRGGIRQIGRSMSMNRAKKPELKQQPNVNSNVAELGSSAAGVSVDRQRSKEMKTGSAGSSGARKGLSQIGRTLSKLRPKTAAVQTSSSPQSSSTISPCTQSTNDPFDEPLSPGTAGLSAVLSVPPSRGDRESIRSNTSSIGTSSNASKKQATKKALRATGRALSLSRKPKKDAADAWSAAHTSKKKGETETNGVVVTEPLTAEKINGRTSDFFFCDINSERIKSCGLLGEENSKIRVPVLVMSEYAGPVSRSRWFIDAFTLPHNAVRQECMDMYDIIIAIVKQGAPGEITKDDISDFYDWWCVAQEFFNRYFDMERKVVFPWVDAAGADDWEVQLALRKMRSMKDRLRELMNKVQVAWDGRNGRSAEETFVLVYKAIDSFAPKMMKYFKDQEILLPAIVKGFYTIEDRLKMDKDMVSAFAGSSGWDGNRDDVRHHVVLLARWMSNPRQMRAWISKNLSSSGRSLFPKWQDNLEHEHLRIVKTFRNRVVVKNTT